MEMISDTILLDIKKVNGPSSVYTVDKQTYVPDGRTERLFLKTLLASVVCNYCCEDCLAQLGSFSPGQYMYKFVKIRM